MILSDYSVNKIDADMSGNGFKIPMEDCNTYKNIMDIPLEMISNSEIMGNGI